MEGPVIGPCPAREDAPTGADDQALERASTAVDPDMAAPQIKVDR